MCGGRPGDGDADCRQCHGRGEWVVTQCPRKFLAVHGGGVGELVRLADFARDGAWPEAGGINDQPDSFVHAARLLWTFETLLRDD